MLEIVPLTLTGLPQPDNCADDEYALMLQCWHLDSANRPSFSQMFEFFNRKTFQLTSQQETALDAAEPRNYVIPNLENPYVYN